MKTSDRAPYQILYEDSSLLAVYKKREVFSVPTDDKKTYAHNLFGYLRSDVRKKNETLYLIHRLDYETSGVMIFAKTPEVQRKLKESFEDRTVKRLYEAVVAEKIPVGKTYSVHQYLQEEGKKTEVSPTPEEGKEAITLIRAVNPIQIGTALQIEIQTGRHNQIRVALASLGLTLLGDSRYSHSEAKRLYLNAYSLAFPAGLGLAQNVFETPPLWIREA
jgi:23S rRNA pseudouridine1911/1915/1917 synthase